MATVVQNTTTFLQHGVIYDDEQFPLLSISIGKSNADLLSVADEFFDLYKHHKHNIQKILDDVAHALENNFTELQFHLCTEFIQTLNASKNKDNFLTTIIEIFGVSHFPRKYIKSLMVHVLERLISMYF